MKRVIKILTIISFILMLGFAGKIDSYLLDFTVEPKWLDKCYIISAGLSIGFMILLIYMEYREKKNL